MDEKIFGKRLKEARKAAGLCQQELANILGVSCDSVRRLERSINMPALHTAVLMADTLGVSLDWLTGRSNYESKKA